MDLERRRPIQPKAATVLHISAGGHERIGDENDMVVVIDGGDLVRARVCGQCELLVHASDVGLEPRVSTARPCSERVFYWDAPTQVSARSTRSPLKEIKARNHNQNCRDGHLSIHFLDRLVEQEDYRSAPRDIVVDINIFNFNPDPFRRPSLYSSALRAFCATLNR